MLLVRIFCRDLKNTVVFEDGIKLGGEKGSKLVSSYNYFEGDIDDKFYWENNLYIIKYGKR